MALAAAVSILHVGGSGVMVVSTLTRDQTASSGRSLSHQAALFRTALLTSHGDGPRKGGPNIAFVSFYPAG